LPSSNIFQKCSNIFRNVPTSSKNVGFINYLLNILQKCCNIFLEMMEHFFKKTSACRAADCSTASARGREGGCGSGHHGRPRRHAAMAGMVELGPQPWSAARGARSALLELITWISTHSHALSGLHTQARISLASCSRWMQTEDKHIRHSRTQEHKRFFYAAHQRTHKHFSSLHALLTQTDYRWFNSHALP
jgi:hypothetical protein